MLATVAREISPKLYPIRNMYRAFGSTLSQALHRMYFGFTKYLVNLCDPNMVMSSSIYASNFLLVILQQARPDDEQLVVQHHGKPKYEEYLLWMFVVM